MRGVRQRGALGVAVLVACALVAQLALAGPVLAQGAPTAVAGLSHVAGQDRAGAPTLSSDPEKTEPIPPDGGIGPQVVEGPPVTEAGVGEPSEATDPAVTVAISRPDAPEPADTKTEAGPGRPDSGVVAVPSGAENVVDPSVSPDSARAQSGPYSRTLDPGQQTTYAITFQNNGTSTWRSADGFALRENGVVAGGLGGCNNLAPGGICSWSYTRSAGTPGTSILDYRMYHGETPFGDTIRVTLVIRTGPGDGAAARSGPYTRTLDTGMQTTYDIVFENVGGTTWRAADGYAVRENGAPAGGLGGCDNLTNASRCSWTYTFTAGSTPGTITRDYRMYHGNTPFGDTIRVTITVRESVVGDRATARSGPHSRTVEPGRQVTYDIAFLNGGITTWRAASGYVLRENGQTATPLGNCDNLAPSASCTWLFTLTAGATAGTFTYDYQMYHGNIPFGDTIRVTVVVRTTPPPSNDAFGSAAGLGVSARVTGDSTSASVETGEPKPSCLTPTASFGRTVWYRLAPASNGTLTVSTAGSSFDTVLALYSGSSVSALTPVPNGCNDDENRSAAVTTSKVTVNLNGGQVYYLQVSGFASAGGAFVVQTSFAGQPTLRVSKAGSGGGTVTGPGISCGSDCTEQYQQGTSVTLSAAANANSVFAGWSGACSGTGSCTVSMSGDKNVTATFQSLGVSSCQNRPPVRVTVSSSGDGRLLATILPGEGLLRLIQLGVTGRPLQNAIVDVVGGPTGLTSGQSVDLSPGQAQVQLYVRRVGAGPVTVPLIVFDDCGSWQTLLGAGAGRL